jgi:hypothetical protein
VEEMFVVISGQVIDDYCPISETTTTVVRK